MHWHLSSHPLVVAVMHVILPVFTVSCHPSHLHCHPTVFTVICHLSLSSSHPWLACLIQAPCHCHLPIIHLSSAHLHCHLSPILPSLLHASPICHCCHCWKMSDASNAADISLSVLPFTHCCCPSTAHTTHCPCPSLPRIC